MLAQCRLAYRAGRARVDDAGGFGIQGFGCVGRRPQGPKPGQFHASYAAPERAALPR
jgi:hypothetical protein